MKFLIVCGLIVCGVVTTILLLCAGCETPAKKPDPQETVPAPVEVVNDADMYKCSNYYAYLARQGQVCNDPECEEIHP